MKRLNQLEYVLFEKVGNLILLIFHLLQNTQFPEKSQFPGCSDSCDYTVFPECKNDQSENRREKSVEIKWEKIFLIIV